MGHLVFLDLPTDFEAIPARWADVQQNQVGFAIGAPDGIKDMVRIRDTLNPVVGARLKVTTCAR
ncbi:MAG: hypothetical protein KKG92_14540 [Gammaproteobacteria bacterium]|nr:hypothetical protein [Gammaproteobacteria bacterium]